MKLEYITTPENAIYRFRHGYFAAGEVATADLGMRLLLAGADIGRHAPAAAGAKLVFEWQGNFIEGEPPFNPGGNAGRDMHGSSGTLYILDDARVFVPIGSQMLLSHIDFYDTAALKSYALMDLKENQNFLSRLIGRSITEEQVERECAWIKKRYADLNRKFSVIV